MKILKLQGVAFLGKLLLATIFLQTSTVIGQSDTKVSTENEIKEALRLETLYFVQRDLINWQKQWSQSSHTMKCYLWDGEYIEQLGWPVILQSAKDYMKKHPQPEAPPTEFPAYAIKVFGQSAMVTYVVDDPKRGKKREVRFMVKEDDHWKINYMSTNYYTD